MAHPGNRTIVEADGKNAIWTVPDITGIATLVSGGANFLAKRVFATVSWVTTGGSGWCKVRNLACLDSGVEGVHPRLRELGRIRLGIGIFCAPF